MFIEINSPKILGFEFTDNELQEVLDKYKINIKINNDTTRWLAVGIDYAVNNKLSDIAAISFGKVLSFLMTDMCVSDINSADFVHENEIKDKALHHKSISKDKDIKIKKQNLFNYLFDLYKESDIKQ